MLDRERIVSEVQPTELESPLDLARREARRIKNVWQEAADRIEEQFSQGLWVEPNQARLLEILKKKISGERRPGKAARRSINRVAGTLPKGWHREVFAAPRPINKAPNL